MQSSCQPNTEAGLERREINADPALAGPTSTPAKATVDGFHLCQGFRLRQSRMVDRSPSAPASDLRGSLSVLAIESKRGYAFGMPFRIRPVLPSDRTQWEALWNGYQTFYKTKIPAQTTDITWARFFDRNEPIYALVAEEDGSLIGLVHYLFHRSTWTAGPYCYLQDLFTSETARGKGVGRALIEEVYAAAKREGASRVYWLTHETNVEAKKLYDKVAQNLGFVQYRKDL